MSTKNKDTKTNLFNEYFLLINYGNITLERDIIFGFLTVSNIEMREIVY